jgi:hypothetical protein
MPENAEKFSDKLTLVSLTEALLRLNSALDMGKADGITLQEIQEHLKTGDLIEHLQQRLRTTFSTVRPGVEQHEFFIEGLRRVRDCTGGRERRIFGVENNGVCMLIAYITELIQSAQWDIASLSIRDNRG